MRPSQTVVKSLPSDIKVVDLSADFRLKDVAVYAKWYGGEHLAPELQKEAVYGLTEHKREEVKKARLVANPGETRGIGRVQESQVARRRSRLTAAPRRALQAATRRARSSRCCPC